MGSGLQVPGFKSLLCLFLVMRHGTISVITLWLCFLILEQREQKSLLDRVDVVINLDDAYRALSIMPDT